MTPLDETDRALIAALRADARAPLTSLAATLRVSRARVKARIDRLVARGVIQGFTVILSPGAEAAPIRAITLVEIVGGASERVAKKLHGLPQVKAVHATSGRWDLVVEIEVATLEAFDAVLREIRHIDGIANSESNLLLAAIRIRAKMAAWAAPERLTPARGVNRGTGHLGNAPKACQN